MSQYSGSNDLDNLLYNSTSQYDEDEDLRKQLDSVQDKFLKQKALDSDDQDGVELGNGESIEGDQEWDDNEEGSAWNNQQQTKFYFREVAGNSEQFSQSLSIHKPDFLESRSMHDNSIQNINLNNILNNKKKEETVINQFIGKECQSFARTMREQQQKIKKQQCLISGYVLKISKLQKNLQEVKNQNYQLDQRNNEYLRKLGKRDQLFKTLKEEYEKTVERLKEEEELSESKSQKIEQLNSTLRAFTDSDRGLTDFRSITPKRSKQSFRSTTPSRERELDREIQKLRRQKTMIETEFQINQEELTRKEERFKTVEDELMRKISNKDKKIHELEEMLENTKEQIGKNKKNYENYANQLKKKLNKNERDLAVKQQKIRECEHEIKNSLEEREKNFAIIKDLRIQNDNKVKKIGQLKRQLDNQKGRNHIESSIQKQREAQFEKMKEQLKEVTTQKYNLKKQLQNLDKPSSMEQKLKKQIQNLKKDNEKLKKELKNLNEDIKVFQEEIGEKDDKIRQFKRKADEASKKNQLLTKKKSSADQQKQQQMEAHLKQLLEYKQLVGKLNRQNSELRKRAQKNQEMANKLYILQSRIKFSQDERDEEEQQFNMEEELQDLREELEQKEFEINDLKEAHMREIQRMTNENQTLSKAIEELEKNLDFKQKGLDFLHAKFVEIEKENAELKVGKNILHSSFYDQSYDNGDSEAIHFYENKIAMLQKKVQSLVNALRQKQMLLERNSDRADSTSRFQVNQLKARVRQLQAMVIRNEPSRKIAPESLSQQQTIQFLLKTLKRVSKSNQMLRSLSRIQDFRTVIFNLEKSIERQMRGR